MLQVLRGKPCATFYVKALRRKEHRKLRERKKTNLEKADKDVQKFKIDKMLDFLEQQPSDLLEYDDKLVRQLIKKITVNDKNLIIEFKSGIEVEEQV